MTNVTTRKRAGKPASGNARIAEADAVPMPSIPQGAPEPAKPLSKASRVLAMLQRPAGATVAQLIAETGWQPHTTRAALTGLKKKGHRVASTKIGGETRIYHVVEN